MQVPSNKITKAWYLVLLSFQCMHGFVMAIVATDRRVMDLLHFFFKIAVHSVVNVLRIDEEIMQ